MSASSGGWLGVLHSGKTFLLIVCLGFSVAACRRVIPLLKLDEDLAGCDTDNKYFEPLVMYLTVLACPEESC